MTTANRELLTMALVGYISQREALEVKIREIREQLAEGEGAYLMAPAKRRGRPPAAVPIDTPVPTKKKRRAMSAEGRAAIAAATKKRWAAFRKAKRAAAK